jgi:hypothetical protein
MLTRRSGDNALIMSASREEAGQRRFHHRLPNGTDTWLSTYIGLNTAEKRATGRADEAAPAGDGELYPVAYLVEQAPGSLIIGHYHRADQFQVFVGGEGNFGRKALSGVSVHYAGAFTPYAPITAGSGPLEYFTLRNGWDPGARWMPQFRDELKAQRDRPPHDALGLVAMPPVTGSHTSDVAVQAVIAPAASGMGAWAYTMPAGAGVEGPDPATGRGQYWLIVQGSCTVREGRTLGARGLLFVPPDEKAMHVTADEDDTLVLVMQFGRAQ